jgi:FdhD protein
MDSLVEHPEIIRHDNGGTVVKTDVVLKEYKLLISVNGVTNYHVTCTRTSLEAFVVGYLFGENLINDHDDIHEITLHETETDGSAYVKIVGSGVPQQTRTGTAAMDFFDAYPKPEGEFRVSGRRVLAAVSECSDRSELFLSTGCVHSCALCDPSGIMFFEEDISRHNALDKIIGDAIINRIRLDGCYVVTSGRVPLDMMVKIVRAGIPLAVSRSAPTDSAISLAKKNNVTLIGFARGSRMNLYSCPERIVS